MQFECLEELVELTSELFQDEKNHNYLLRYRGLRFLLIEFLSLF